MHLLIVNKKFSFYCWPQTNVFRHYSMKAYLVAVSPSTLVTWILFFLVFWISAHGGNPALGSRGGDFVLGSSPVCLDLVFEVKHSCCQEQLNCAPILLPWRFTLAQDWNLLLD
jgi:hypothetical protein